MLRRPKPGEDDDELMRLQEAFQRGRTPAPAAACVKGTGKRKADGAAEEAGVGSSSGSVPHENIHKRKVSHAQKKEEVKRERVVHDAKDIIEDSLSAVMGDIIEKNTGRDVVALLPVAAGSRGFPEVLEREKKFSVEECGTKKKSIFAHQFEQMRKQEVQKMEVDEASTGGNPVEKEDSTDRVYKKPAVSQIGEQSYVVDGSGLGVGSEEALRIHQENVEKFSLMNEEEILKEQQQLLQNLDPKLVAFMRSRRQRVCTSLEEVKENMASTVERDNMKAISRERDALGVNSNGMRTESSTSRTAGEKQVTVACADEKEKGKSVRFAEDSKQRPDHEETIQLSESLLPINPSEAKKWLHMDVVETEKLNWMTDLPAPKAIDTNTGYAARFDFEGLLLPYDAGNPVTDALHHHGEEPERAGYTLDELFQFIRSTIIQQRLIGLQIMTGILRKAKTGVYNTCFEQNLLQQVLDAGVLILLRFSLDDNMEAMINASSQAFHGLIYNEPDELSLDHVFSWHQGHVQPALPSDVEKKQEEKKQFQEEEREMKDIDIVHLDVVRAILRIDTLPRLRYILDILRPTPRAVISILELLTRVARHSLDAANAVLSCPWLLSTIVSNFLPHDWTPAASSEKPVDMRSVYNVPLRQAMKLLRVLAAWGRNIAADIMVKYHIMDVILAYISVDPSETDLPMQECLLLSLESYRMWRTLLSYGLAAQQYKDFYPLLMQQLRYYQTAISVNEAVSSNKFNYDHGSSLLGVLEATVHIAATHAELNSKVTFRPPGSLNGSTVEDVLPPPPVNWSHVAGLHHPVRTCLQKWLWELTRADDVNHSSLNIAASAMNFLSAFYEKFYNQPFFNVVDCLENIKELCVENMQPFLSSGTFRGLMQKLSSSSVLICSYESGCKSDPQTLPSLGSLTWSQLASPILQWDSPLHFLLALARFLTMCYTVHKKLDPQVSELLLQNRCLGDYFRKLCLAQGSLTNHWFVRYEVHFVYYTLKLATLTDCSDYTLFHQVALALSLQVLMGDEDLLQDLLTSVIFSPKLFVEHDDLVSRLNELQLSETVTIASASRKTGTESRACLLHIAYCRLASIRSTFLRCLFPSSSEASCSRSRQIPHKVSSLTVVAGSQTVLPADWPHLPTMILYSTVMSRNENSRKTASQSSDTASSDMVVMVTDCIQWTLLLECWRPQFMVYTKLNATAHFCRLACVFLAGSDLFLDQTVHSYIEANLKELLKGPAKLDFKSDIPGLQAFSDLYLQLVEQFLAVSYGDQLFGLFVLLPLQQTQDIHLKHMIWGEYNSAIRLLSVPFDQLPVSLTSFLEPPEADQHLLSVYFQALASGDVRATWSPVLHRAAIHHVAHFVAKGEDCPLRKSMKSHLHLFKHQAVAAEILEYTHRCFPTESDTSAVGSSV